MWPVRPSNSTCPRENELQRPSGQLTPPPAAEPGVAAARPAHRPSTLPAATATQSSCLDPNCFWSLARVALRDVEGSRRISSARCRAPHISLHQLLWNSPLYSPSLPPPIPRLSLHCSAAGMNVLPGRTEPLAGDPSTKHYVLFHCIRLVFNTRAYCNGARTSAYPHCAD